jgi:Kazal-type serine protease inhibitor domain
MTKTARAATKTGGSVRTAVTRRGLLACAFVALGTSLGCGRHLNEVASAADDGGDDAEIPCSPTIDAACKLNRCAGSCDDPTTGKCESIPEPSTCTGGYSPVCGCNGVTYFNDCLRKAAQANLAVTGQCGQLVASCEGGRLPCLEGPGPKPCDPTGSCDDADGGAVCAFLVSFPVPVPPAGDGLLCGALSVSSIFPPTCWVLPTSCPAGDEATATNCSYTAFGPLTPCAALKLHGVSFLGSNLN